MRVGERLLRKGALTPQQLAQALHEQARYGGRLGTSLVQLGYVDVDTLALTLSEQRAVPPVLREHVASIDKRALGLIPARLVTAHRAVPIGLTTSKPPRVVVACVDPTALPIDELSFAA